MFGDKITKLSNKSANIISVFTKTIDELTTVNVEISNEVLTKNIIIAKLKDEVDTLDTLVISNHKIILKVKSIIE